MTKIKICGITNDDDLSAAVKCGANYVGFIVDIPIESHRQISAKLAKELTSNTPSSVTTTMVTILENPKRTLDFFDQINPDALQIHGNFTFDVVQEISDVIDGKLIVSLDPNAEIANQLEGVADAILCDSQGERGAGGTGKTNDWDSVREFREETKLPVILAGGLTPQNVSQAINLVDPFAVDVASGVERPDGLKDHGAIFEFITNVHKKRSGNDEFA